KVYVLVRYKPISSIVKYLPFKSMKVHDENIVIDLKNLPKNVEVIKTPVWYIPFGIFNRFLGEAHYKAVQNTIDDWGIKFDIVHCHFLWSSGYVGMKLKEKYGVPFVVTGHGFDVYQLPFKSKYWKNKITTILKASDTILTVSEYNKRYLKELDFQLDKIKVVHNGFSSKDFCAMSSDQARKSLGIDNNKRVIVAVGNLERIKGFDVLVESLKTLNDDDPRVVCFILGGGTEYSSLSSQIKKQGLENKVVLKGHVPHSSVGKWINACDVLVIPSRRESASVVLLEAIACGKPVVGTRVGIIPEVITSDLYGYICEIEDSDCLSEKINLAMNRKWDTKKIENLSKEFSWERSVGKILEEYDKLLKSSF
ncbi:MAG: glycosyltransferase, partial [bacterium]